MKRYLLDCGHYALGEGQLVGDDRSCEVCPSHDHRYVTRMIVDAASVSQEIVSAEFIESRQRMKERPQIRHEWSPAAEALDTAVGQQIRRDAMSRSRRFA